MNTSVKINNVLRSGYWVKCGDFCYGRVLEINSENNTIRAMVFVNHAEHFSDPAEKILSLDTISMVINNPAKVKELEKKFENFSNKTGG